MFSLNIGNLCNVSVCYVAYHTNKKISFRFLQSLYEGHTLHMSPSFSLYLAMDFVLLCIIQYKCSQVILCFSGIVVQAQHFKRQPKITFHLPILVIWTHEPEHKIFLYF